MSPKPHTLPRFVDAAAWIWKFQRHCITPSIDAREMREFRQVVTTSIAKRFG